MSDAFSIPGADEVVLARFVKALEAAPDPDLVLREFCAGYEPLAEEFRSLASMIRQLKQSVPPVAIGQPERLGEFRIVRSIGRGGMGEIYEAVQERLHRRVAVKTIRQGHISPDARARFLREQIVLARLHQTHIVPIHTAGEEGPLQYFAMPYIEGAALHHVVQAALRRETSQPGSETPSLAELAGMVATGNPKLPSISEHSGEAHARGDNAAVPDRATGEASVRLTLSSKYYRSVALLMVDAAEALHHAHEVQILHRDVKPSNFMVDRHGHCWLLDFGLACLLKGAGPSIGLLDREELPEPTTHSRVAGTPQYMAPEQFAGKTDVRSDVWGLGVTLYELLTLQRAFGGRTFAEVRDQVTSGHPVPAEQRVRKLPADLAAICRKALCKDPAERYPTAHAFAEDLQRWLRLEPTSARPARTPRRMLLWARRNQGAAAASVWALFSFIALAVSAVLFERHKADHAVAEAATAHERELLLQLQGHRLSIHKDGWFEDCWGLVREIAKTHQSDELRNQAAAALSGIDARAGKEHRTRGASSVAWDAAGKRLLIGGWTNEQGQPEETALLWERDPNQLTTARQAGTGPVAFNRAGIALQLVVAPDRRALQLWNVVEKRITLVLRPDPADGPVVRATAMAGDAALAAAGAIDAAGKDLVLLWDGVTGKLLQRFPEKASAFAFAPDNSLLACGHEDGRITGRSLPSAVPLASFPAGPTEIKCLAFQRDRLRRGTGKHPLGGWLLAAGDAGGSVTVWDLETERPRSFCRGSEYHVHAVAFSPDGTTLASGGRGPTKLWDSATGRLLLSISTEDWLTGLAFSPDGRTLAVSRRQAYGDIGGFILYHLDVGRGIQTLYGLTSRAEHVTFSPDGRLLAALSHGSQVAVWDLARNHLLHLFEAPPARWVDNAAIAFSPDSKQLAYAGSSETTGQARLWEVASGKELGAWSYPPGLQSLLAFHPQKHLLLFQIEDEAGKGLPGEVVPRRRPVCRVRPLEVNPRMPLLEISEFTWSVDKPVVPSDGRFVIVVGYNGTTARESRLVKAFDTLSGKEFWSGFPSTRVSKEDVIDLGLDRAGRYLSVYQSRWRDPEARTALVEMPAGKMLGFVEWSGRSHAWSPTRRYWLDFSDVAFPTQLSLVRRGKKTPVVVLAIDQPRTPGSQFNVPGTHLAWGQADGIVSVCDIEAVRQRLEPVHLGW